VVEDLGVRCAFADGHGHKQQLDSQSLGALEGVRIQRLGVEAALQSFSGDYQHNTP